MHKHSLSWWLITKITYITSISVKLLMQFLILSQKWAEDAESALLLLNWRDLTVAFVKSSVARSHKAQI